MATIHDVASYVLQRFDEPISTMKLQKLAFFAQGWSLALLNSELFSEDFEAWRAGPVSYDLFDRHRGMHSLTRWECGDSSQITDAQRVTLDAMLRNYGALSGPQLSELTHRSGTPWSQVRQKEQLVQGSRSRAIIDKKLIASFFKETLLKG